MRANAIRMFSIVAIVTKKLKPFLRVSISAQPTIDVLNSTAVDAPSLFT